LRREALRPPPRLRVERREFLKIAGAVSRTACMTIREMSFLTPELQRAHAPAFTPVTAAFSGIRIPIILAVKIQAGRSRPSLRTRRGSLDSTEYPQAVDGTT